MVLPQNKNFEKGFCCGRLDAACETQGLNKCDKNSRLSVRHRRDFEGGWLAARKKRNTHSQGSNDVGRVQSVLVFEKTVLTNRAQV